MTDQTLGHAAEESGEQCEYLTLSFSPLSAPLRSRWRNNGLSADFLGDYVVTFLPANEDIAGGAWSNQSEVKHAVTYIANEFLENAMKYHQRDVDIPIGIRLELTSNRVVVSATNGISDTQAERYKEFVEGMLLHDPGELLLRQLEASSAGTQENESCIGLLTMVSDYGAQLGWRFENHPAHPSLLTVTTSAVLSLKSFPGAAA